MDEFRTQIIQGVREVVLREQQHESSFKTWQGGESKGFEVVFEGMKRAVPIQSGVTGQIFISQDGGFEAIITTYVVKNQLRSIVSSFTLTPSSSLPTQIASKLSKLSLAVASSISVTHLLMIPQVCQRILNSLATKHAARLGQTCKTARNSLTSSSVDGTYWKANLKKDFGVEKVRETIAKNRKFHGVYCEEKLKTSTSRNRGAVQTPAQNPLLISSHDPLRVPPRRNPYNPNNPDAEYFVPQGGFMPPGIQPRGNQPDFPDFFPGPNHPDLNPLGGGLQREIFGPPRGGRGNQGNPFMRGGGGGFI
uniref:Uncharacterized protein n=1 Tax=Caenorhabditis japonica TaxID=281687 RepID=A0A8R1IAL4_CAEJA